MSFRTDDAAVLRRRAKAMRDLRVAIDRDESIAGVMDRTFVLCGDSQLAVLERAAETLEVITRHPNQHEQTVLTLLADNRQLRRALVGVNELLTITEVAPANKKRAAELIRTALRVQQTIGDGRVVLAIEIEPGETRADIDAHVARQLDPYFAAMADAKATKGSMTGAAVVDEATPAGGSE